MAWATLTNLSTNDLVTEAHMDAIRGNIEYLLDPNKVTTEYNGGSGYSTTSTSFVDVDGTNVKVTLTTNGGPVLVIFSGSAYSSGGTYATYFDIDVDGTRLGNANTGGLQEQQGAASVTFAFTVVAIIDGLTAGSHTFKLKWKTTGTSVMYSQTGNQPVLCHAIEL